MDHATLVNSKKHGVGTVSERKSVYYAYWSIETIEKFNKKVKEKKKRREYIEERKGKTKYIRKENCLLRTFTYRNNIEKWNNKRVKVKRKEYVDHKWEIKIGYTKKQG